MDGNAHADKRARRRLVMALLWGFGIWLFAGLVFRDGVVVRNGNHHRAEDGVVSLSGLKHWCMALLTPSLD